VVRSVLKFSLPYTPVGTDEETPQENGRGTGEMARFIQAQRGPTR
jgi:hypothetical protein